MPDLMDLVQQRQQRLSPHKLMLRASRAGCQRQFVKSVTKLSPLHAVQPLPV